jgi:CBS domain-containing protein
MLVRDIMTSPAVTIRPDDEVAEAARVLDRLSLTSLPVVDRDLRLLGIITEADLIDRLSTTPYTPGDPRRVAELMTRRVLTVSADDEVALVVDLMRRTILKSLPVMLHDRLVGMVSRRDVVHALAQGELDAYATDELSRT